MSLSFELDYFHLQRSGIVGALRVRSRLSMIFHNRDIGSVEVLMMTFQPFLILKFFVYLSLTWIFP